MHCQFTCHHGRLDGDRAARAHGEHGSTLIEVIVSALLVALIAAAVAQALVGSAYVSGDQRHRSQADEVAQQDQARLRGLSAAQLVGLSQTRTVTLDGTPYTVSSSAQFLNSTGGSSCGSSGSGAASYFRVLSSVNWTSNTRSPIQEESIITPPAGGTLLTQVLDQTGAPLAGVTVTASGPDSASAVTDANGCTTFAALATGVYTLTLADPGYVDQNANPSPLSTTATLTSTGTATPSGGNPITMGLAGSIAANFTTKASSGSLTGQQADSLSWLGTGASSGMSSSSTSGPLAAPAALIPATGSIQLYPFAFSGPSYTSNYQVWAGPCRQNAPPIGTDMFNVAPGSNQTAASALAVAEPAVNVVVNYAGARVKPDHVKITFNGTSGPPCSRSWYPVVSPSGATSANGSLLYPGQPFASTSTSGASASASGYTGTLTVCADYDPPGTTTARMAYSSVFANTSFVGQTTVTIPLTSSSSGGTC
jgi:hypothetical protein